MNCEQVFDESLLAQHSVFSLLECQYWLDQLIQHSQWQFDSSAFARGSDPRLKAWYADEGVPCHILSTPLQRRAWTAPLSHIKHRVEQACNQLFNSALVTYYQSSEDLFDWNNIRKINAAIASLTLCDQRTLIFCNKKNSIERVVSLENGTAIVLHPGLVDDWELYTPSRKDIFRPHIDIMFGSFSAMTSKQNKSEFEQHSSVESDIAYKNNPSKQRLLVNKS